MPKRPDESFNRETGERAGKRRSTHKEILHRRKRHRSDVTVGGSESEVGLQRIYHLPGEREAEKEGSTLFIFPGGLSISALRIRDCVRHAAAHREGRCQRSIG